MKYTFYKICCKNETIMDCYVSVTADMDKTISKHTKRYKKNHPNKLYQCIRNNGGLKNWEIKIILNYEAKPNEDLTIILKHYILGYNANLNYEDGI